MATDKMEQENEARQFGERCAEYGKAINEGRHQDAEEIALQMLQMATLSALTEEPSQETIWKRMAAECEERRNWAGAEEAMRNALELARQNEVREYPIKTHLDLASLYEMLGREEDELAQVEAAVELGRNSEIFALRTMVLQAQCMAFLAKGDFSAARGSVAEALAPLPDDKLHELLKARLLVLLARCEASAGNLDLGEKTLQEALDLLRAYRDNKFMGGLQAFFASAAATAAVILAARGKKKEAALRFGETVERARTIAEQPHLQGVRANYRLAQALKKYGEYLESADLSEAATQARRESETILADLHLPEARPPRPA